MTGTALPARTAAAAARTPALAAYVLMLAGVIWGAFAFGAVYPWAYWPLAAGAVVAAALALANPFDSAQSIADLAPIASGCVVIAFAISLQTIPVPLSALRVASPETVRLLEATDLLVASGVAQRHPLSIDSGETVTALALFVAFALVVFGAARLFTLFGARRFAEAVAFTGVALALAGLAQHGTFNGKIYGLWTPEEQGVPFGPFVNRNHFAGWMLMAVPLTVGVTCGHIARAMRGIGPRRRDRLMWFASPDASRLILIAGSALVMSLALVLTMSRGGMLSIAVALAATAALALRSGQQRIRRAVALGFLIALVVTVVSWVGSGAIATRFSDGDWQEISARRGAWLDAWSIAQRFPLAGTGLNTYGLATLVYQRHNLELHFAQAHNDYLQLAAEGGALVAVPVLATLGAFVLAVKRRFTAESSEMTYWVRVGAATGLAAIALQETVDFSLQMPGNAFLFATLCAIALHRTPARSHSSPVPLSAS